MCILPVASAFAKSENATARRSAVGSAANDEENIAASAGEKSETVSRIGHRIDEIWEAQMKLHCAESLQELIWKYADTIDNGHEWFVISLAQRYAGQLDFSEYRNAFEAFISRSETPSASYKLKAALTLQAIGGGQELIDKLTESGIGNLGIMSYIYGLHALQNGANSTSHTKEDVINTLLDMQLPDGGWAVMGENGDVDVTAMTIQALAFECEENDSVRKACEKGIELLSKRQKKDGSFISYGDTNAESTAQVLFALSSMGIDWTEDERFIKKYNGKEITVEDVLDSFYLGNGLYEHVAGGGGNNGATVQALYTYTDIELALSGKGRFYSLRSGNFTEPHVQRPEASRPADTANNQDQNIDSIQNSDDKSIKKWLYIAIAAAAVIGCAALLILKKRSYKSYLFIVILAIIAAAGVRFINIEKPSDYYGKTEVITDPVKTTISIRCDTVAGEKDHIPKDGIILDNFEVVINKGQTAYDQIIAAVREESIHIDAQSNGYISGIANIYEFDFGDLSGWMYKVNGKFADVGCGEYKLLEGDAVEWQYTTNLGKDIGNEYHGDR